MTALIALLSFFSVWILLGGRTTPWNNVVYAILGYVTGGWIRLYWQESTTKSGLGTSGELSYFPLR